MKIVEHANGSQVPARNWYGGTIEPPQLLTRQNEVSGLRMRQWEFKELENTLELPSEIPAHALLDSGRGSPLNSLCAKSEVLNVRAS